MHAAIERGGEVHLPPLAALYSATLLLWEADNVYLQSTCITGTEINPALPPGEFATPANPGIPSHFDNAATPGQAPEIPIDTATTAAQYARMSLPPARTP